MYFCYFCLRQGLTMEPGWPGTMQTKLASNIDLPASASRMQACATMPGFCALHTHQAVRSSLHSVKTPSGISGSSLTNTSVRQVCYKTHDRSVLPLYLSSPNMPNHSDSLRDKQCTYSGGIKACFSSHREKAEKSRRRFCTGLPLSISRKSHSHSRCETSSAIPLYTAESRLAGQAFLPKSSKFSPSPGKSEHWSWAWWPCLIQH